MKRNQKELNIYIYELKNFYTEQREKDDKYEKDNGGYSVRT